MNTIIDTLIERHENISLFFEEKNEISLKTDSDEEFKKVLILCIASYFEHHIIDSILQLTQKYESEKIINLIKMKAISRQYHTYFDWDKNNVNKFLSLFGDNFKNNISMELRSNIALNDGAKNFLQLGEKRNILVHENFASASVDWTIKEIVEKYKKALTFVEYVSNKIIE